MIKIVRGETAASESGENVHGDLFFSLKQTCWLGTLKSCICRYSLFQCIILCLGVCICATSLDVCVCECVKHCNSSLQRSFSQSEQALLGVPHSIRYAVVKLIGGQRAFSCACRSGISAFLVFHRFSILNADEFSWPEQSGVSRKEKQQPFCGLNADVIWSRDVH